MAVMLRPPVLHHQAPELGRGRSRGYPHKIQVRRVGGREKACEGRRLAALRMSPHREGTTIADTGNRSRSADGIDHGSGLAFADEIGMHPRRPEAGVIGCGDRVAAIQHVLQSLNRSEERASQ